MILSKPRIASLLGARPIDPCHRPFAAIVRCADVCNYDCVYCYAKPSLCHGIMPVAIAQETIRKVLRFCGPQRRAHFVWHGGEPTLAGMDFFKAVAGECRKHADHDFENSIQTNGWTLDQDWIDFCQEEGFHLSTSLDGPEWIHNRTRRGKDGLGTYSATMRAVELLRANDLSVNCVAVLHSQNLPHLREVYDFFRREKINFRINPIVRIRGGSEDYNALAIDPQEYGTAMCDLFDWWWDDDDGPKVEPLMTFVGNFVDDQVWGCDNHGRCLQSIVSFNPDGGIHPCGRFSSEDGYCLGNVMECDRLEDVFAAPDFVCMASRDASSVKGCRTCEFRDLCNGGCMITAYMARGKILDRDYYCPGKKMLLHHILDRLVEDLDGARH